MLSFFLILTLVLPATALGRISAFYLYPSEGNAPLYVTAECRVIGEDNTSSIVIDWGDGTSSSCSCKENVPCRCIDDHTFTTTGNKNVSCQYKGNSQSETVNVLAGECTVSDLTASVGATVIDTTVVAEQNSPVSITLKLASECTGSISITSVTAESPFTVASNSCPALSPGGSCSITVQTPGSETSGTIRIETTLGSLFYVLRMVVLT